MHCEFHCKSIFGGFHLGFLAWRALVQGRGRAFRAAMSGRWCDQPNLQLVCFGRFFLLQGCSSMFQAKGFKYLWLAFITQGAVPRKLHFTCFSPASPIFQGHERGHSAANPAISDANDEKSASLPRCWSWWESANQAEPMGSDLYW